MGGDLGYIEEIVDKKKNITNALDDIVIARPAILMHMTAIAEQFDKLKKDHAKHLLDSFDEADVKGMYDVRTYIAHEYEGVNIAIVEWIIRNGLPKFKKQCLKLIDEANIE